MTHDPSNLPFSGVQLSDAALIRIAADGERDLLDQAQLARLDQLLSDPDNAARVEAEQSLRQAVSRTYAPASMPQGLEQRLRAKLATANDSTPEKLAPQTRNPSFWRRAAATLAVAAAIALGLVSIFNPTSPTNQGPQVAGLAPQLALARSSVVSHVSNEHRRCAQSAERVLAKGSIVEQDNLPTSVERLMGMNISLQDLIFSDLPDVEFEWAGPCAVPGPRSLHMSFSGEHGESVSVFIQPDQGSLSLDPGLTYTAGSACGEEGPAVYIWSSNGLVYYLVSEKVPGCDNLLRNRAAPEPTQRFLDQL